MADFVGVLLVNAVERHLCESRRLDLIEIGSGHKASGYHEGEKSEPDHACYLNCYEGGTAGGELGRRLVARGTARTHSGLDSAPGVESVLCRQLLALPGTMSRTWCRDRAKHNANAPEIPRSRQSRCAPSAASMPGRDAG